MPQNVARWMANTIPEWSQLSQPERTAIRDFAVLWTYFELYATNRNASLQNVVAAVDHLLQGGRNLPPIPRSDAAAAYFAEIFFHEGQPTELYTEGLWRRGAAHPGPGGEQEIEAAGHIENTLTNLENSLPENRLKTVLLLTTRFRNNYLHGGKAQRGFQGQFYHFTHCNNVLMEAIPFWMP